MKIEVDTRFNPGDIVSVMGTSHRTLLSIIQVQTSTCPGGTQVEYVGNVIKERGDLRIDLCRLNDCQVEPFSEEERRKSYRPWIDHLLNVRVNEDEASK